MSYRVNSRQKQYDAQTLHFVVMGNVTNALVLNIVLLVIGSTLLHFRERCVLNACTVILYTCLREVCPRVHKCYLHLKT